MSTKKSRCVLEGSSLPDYQVCTSRLWVGNSPHYCMAKRASLLFGLAACYRYDKHSRSFPERRAKLRTSSLEKSSTQTPARAQLWVSIISISLHLIYPCSLCNTLICGQDMIVTTAAAKSQQPGQLSFLVAHDTVAGVLRCLHLLHDGYAADFNQSMSMPNRSTRVQSVLIEECLDLMIVHGVSRLHSLHGGLVTNCFQS